MRVCIIGNGSSIHIVQWCNELVLKGLKVHLISKHRFSSEIDQSVTLYYRPYPGIVGYFLMVPGVKKLIKKIQPDVVHAHYASGYGTTAALIDFKPWILSVWGSDVFIFPRKSLIHHFLVKYNIDKADAVASTSQVMADRVLQLSPSVHSVNITPFGVNCEKFKRERSQPNNNPSLVIGTIKSMNSAYGIDVLIRTFAHLKHKMGARNIKLLIVGGGDDVYLKKLARSLDVIDDTDFVGPIPHSRVPEYLSKLDIYLALSRSESFGVSVLEASACEIPVVATRVGGLPEVILENETGFLVESEDHVAAADKVMVLALDPEMRRAMGINGRRFVLGKFSWPVCVNNMCHLYEKVVSNGSL
ncbi:MAG: glycosyltransferase [Alcanivorax sp.]